jgi:hypothetical protein
VTSGKRSAFVPYNEDSSMSLPQTRAIRIAFTTISLVAFAVCIPVLAHADTANLSDAGYHIFPSQCNCPGLAPAWGCVLAAFQNILTFIVAFATIVITIFLAWAGFTYMTSGGSGEKRKLANQRILNAAIGLAIVLCSYLLVDSILQVIYNPSNPQFGPWNSILAQGATTATMCLQVHNPPNALPTVGAANSAGASGTGATQPALTKGVKGPACSGAAVDAAAQAGGLNMSASEANTLACIAGPESNCGAVNQNYNWNGVNGGTASTAWGPFQITLKGNSACLNNSACESAAGVSGPLNCRNAFDSNGHAIPGALLSECQTAASNLGCSAVAANCIVQGNGGSYNAWTGNKDSTAAHQMCVANNAST